MRWEALLVAATGLRLGAGIAWTTLIPLTRGLTGAAPHISMRRGGRLGGRHRSPRPGCHRSAHACAAPRPPDGSGSRTALAVHVRPGAFAVLRAGFVGAYEQAATDSSAWTNSGA